MTAKTLCGRFLAILIFSFLGSRVCFSNEVQGQELEIIGLPWPVEGGEPSNLSGQHPIFSKIACPSLLRSNTKAGNSQPILLNSLPEISSSASKTTWIFNFRSDLSWWSGDAISADFLAEFVSNVIRKSVEIQYSNVWKVPSFTSKWLEPNKLVVEWAESPGFGPGVLTNWPLHRKNPRFSTTTNVPFECAGEFQITSMSTEETVLVSRKSNLRILLYKTENNDRSQKSSKRIRFRTADAFGGSPWVRMSDEAVKCPDIDLPLFLLISWNAEIWPTNSLEIREILTQLTPRGELLRAGAGHLGDLLSAPILRRHPGYNKSVLVRPFSVDQSVKELEKIGFDRPSPEKTRRDAKGRELTLKIQLKDEDSGLIDKVLFDSFYSVGIRVERDNGSGDVAKLNGKILGLFAGSTDFDWLSLLHTSAKSKLLLPTPKDAKLDEMLVEYSKSITMMKPNYAVLREIHRKIYEVEPFSVLMNNRACVDANFSINPQHLDEVNIDPDWLVKMTGIEKK